MAFAFEPGESYWEPASWRSLDSELGSFFRSRYIREAFGSYGMYLGGSPYELPGLFTILAMESWRTDSGYRGEESTRW